MENFTKIRDIGRFDRAGQAEMEIEGLIERDKARAMLVALIEERGLKLNPLNSHIIVDEEIGHPRGDRTTVRAEVVEKNAPLRVGGHDTPGDIHQ